MAVNNLITGDKNQIARRSTILEILNNSGSIRVLDLSKSLDVSTVTIRKDLEDLEAAGVLTRMHGGAKKVAGGEAGGVDYESRRLVKQDEKRRIAGAAAALVNEGDFVVINVGTTCSYVCEELKAKKRLTVVTNALQIVNSLTSAPWITTIFLGGRLNIDMQITVGEEVNEQLKKYVADKLFMGMDGVDALMGATTYNHVEDYIMRQMMLQAKEKILVVDDSKIGKVTFARIAALTDFDAIITNYTDANAEHLEKIRALGVKLITV